MRTEIFRAAGDSEAVFDHFPHVQPEDIADGVMFALSTGPNVRVSVPDIFPLIFDSHWQFFYLFLFLCFYFKVDEVKITPLHRRL